ncbi:MAG: hypothetical protein J6A22_00720 [Bacteroidales bacterium]|nr:hypothetical protein [Bacteroidales bacterium]
MDIDLLSKMVKELILDTDRVALPGLGSFVAEIVPASFSDKGYTINPPYRRLYFRSKPDQGDELSEFYASSNNVSKDIASRIIADFVSELKPVLFSKKTIVFPGLGRLRATKENNVFFVADETLDIYPAGIGLEPVSLKTHQETKAEVDAAFDDLKQILESPSPEPEVCVEPVVQEEAEPSIVESPVNVLQEITVKEQESVPAPVSRRFWKNFFKMFFILLGLAVLILFIIAVLGRVCPEFIDRFLFSEEELRILNY